MKLQEGAGLLKQFYTNKKFSDEYYIISLQMCRM